MDHALRAIKELAIRGEGRAQERTIAGRHPSCLAGAMEVPREYAQVCGPVLRGPVGVPITKPRRGRAMGASLVRRAASTRADLLVRAVQSTRAILVRLEVLTACADVALHAIHVETSGREAVPTAVVVYALHARLPASASLPLP